MLTKTSGKIRFYDDYALLSDNQRRIGGSAGTFALKIRNRQLHYQIVQRIIRDVQDNGPAGLIHARALSRIVKRCIRIWMNDRVVHAFGRFDGKPGIDVEYRKHSIANSQLNVGHWTLRGGKNPHDAATSDADRRAPSSRPIGRNDCLYAAVASQTGLDSAELRRRTASEMRRGWRSLASFAPRWSSANSMLGGARYAGTSPGDAQRVLDASQHGQCHPEGRSGHPRGHASYPSAGRSEDSVETYSYSRWRSGFLSRGEQDLVCHYSLITSYARDLMERLNNGEFKVDAHISRNALDYAPLPRAQRWEGGSPQGSPGDFRTVCLVGKHFLNRQNDPNADIFVLTFYPIL